MEWSTGWCVHVRRREEGDSGAHSEDRAAVNPELALRAARLSPHSLPFPW